MSCRAEDFKGTVSHPSSSVFEPVGVLPGSPCDCFPSSVSNAERCKALYPFPAETGAKEKKYLVEFTLEYACLNWY